MMQNSLKNKIENEYKKYIYDIYKSIDNIDLSLLYKRKNPLMYATYGINDSNAFILKAIEDYISASKETKLGNFLEKIVFIVLKSRYYQVRISKLKGIDIEIEDRKGNIALFQIKSGPNWGNSSQINQLELYFAKAKNFYKNKNVICINGCCYGQSGSFQMNGYIKKQGSEFWKYISGNKDFYENLINLIIDIEKNEDIKTYEEKLQECKNKLTNEISKDFKLTDFC